MASIDASRADPAPVLKILFVDDNELQCSNAVKMLGKYGHEVLTAPSAEEALLLLEQHAFDLAVVDWMLPGGADGLFLTSRICREHPEVPVIVISGESRELKSEAEKAGARRFLPKPFSGKELNDACVEVVAEVRAEAEAAEESDDDNASAGVSRIGQRAPSAHAEVEAIPEGTLTRASAEAERTRIVEALNECCWSRGDAADLLGISRSTLYRRMMKYGIKG